MTSEDHFTIADRCRSLCHDFAALSDFGEIERAAALFTEDGILTRRGEDFIGRRAILDMLRRRPQSSLLRHHMTTVSINVTASDDATGIGYFMLFQAADWQGQREGSPIAAPAAVGEYIDTFRRTPEGWRFAKRLAYLTFR